MADTQFQEVLQINVDLDQFSKQMDQVASIYSAKLGELKGPQISGDTQVVSALKDLQASYERMANNATKNLQDLTAVMLETANQVEAALGKIGKASTSQAGVDPSGGAPKQLAKDIADVEEETAKAHSGWNDFSSAIGRDIPGLIANVIRFQLAWKLIGGIITGLITLPEKFFASIKEGVQYLNDLQDKTADMQGTIANNITLSKSWVENFKLAGLAAENVRKQLEQIAITSGLSVEQLEKAFKATVEGGGGAFAQNINEIVQLTQLFGLAMKAAGKDAEGTRSLISEIPKLLDGSIGNSSKLLEVLHLNKDQWAQIRAEGLAHGDLVSRLAPMMAPYLSVVDQAALRQSVLTEQLDLMQKRVEGAIAEPLWRAWTQVLEDAKQLLTDNQGYVVAIGRSFGEVLLTILSIGKALGPDLAASLVVLAQLVNVLNFTFKTLFTLLSTSVDAVAAMLQHHPDLGYWDSIKQNASDVKGILSGSWTKFNDDLDKAAANMKDMSEGTNSRAQVDARIRDRSLTPADTTAGDSAYKGSFMDITDLQREIAVQQPYFGSSKPRDVSKSHGNEQLRQEYAERLALIKESEKAQRDAIDEAQKQKQISLANAAQQRIASYQNELEKISSLGKQILEKARLEGLKPEQLSALESLVNRTNARSQTTEHSDITKQHDDVTADQQKQDEERLNTNLKLVQQYAKSKLDLEKEYAKEGLVAESQVSQAELESEQAVYEYEELILQHKIDAAGKDAELTQKLTDQKMELEAKHADFVILQQFRIADAKQKEYDQDLKNALNLANIKVQNAQQGLRDAQRRGVSPNAQVGLQTNVAQADVDQKSQAAAQALQRLTNAIAAGKTPQEIQALGIEAQKAGIAFRDSVQILQQTKPGLKKGIQSLGEELFGFDIAQQWKDAGNSWVKKMTVVFDGIVGAISHIGAIVSQIKQGVAQGGALGGVGAGLGIAGSVVSSFNPLAGAIVSAVGSVFSMLGDMFTSAAKHIAEHVQKEISDIMNAFQNGTATLFTTVQQLENERASAITRLSGQKGGQAQLDKLLPGLDQQIAQLQQQQRQIVDQFQQQVQMLHAGGSSITQQWLQDWVQINKQVKDYLDAVGPAGRGIAQEYLDLELAAKRKDLQTQLNDAQQQALQDAMQLNDLLTQRNQLEQDYANQRFAILSADSIERRQSGAITAAQQLAKLNTDYQKQKSQLDYQISQETQKVDIERQVFNIAQDTATMQQQSLQLQLQALQDQKQQWLDIQKILQQTANLVAGPNGFFGGSSLINAVSGGGQPIPGFGGANVTPQITIHNHAPIDGATAKKFASDLSKELMISFRGGVGRNMWAYQ